MQGYLITLRNPKFKDWFEHNMHMFEEKKSESVAKGGKVWHTLNRAVLISQFPKGTLFKFIEPPGKGWGFHNGVRLDDFNE